MAVVSKFPMSATVHSRGRSRRGTGRLLVVMALVFLLTACAQLAALKPKGKTAKGSSTPEIRQLRQQFNQLVALRKMADLAPLLADDVQVITPSKVIIGKKNLVRFQEALVQKRPDLVLIFTPDRVERNPRWTFASESGSWLESWQEQGEAIEMRGSYYTQWKLKDGHWRIQSQIMTPVSCKGDRYCKSQE